MPVRNSPTRKTFFAKLLGLIAVAGVVPKLAAEAAKPVPVRDPIRPQTEPRAVARTDVAA